MSSASPTEVGRCPLCDASQVESSVAGFDGLCTACGYVIPDEGEPEPPEWLSVSSREEDDTATWTDEATVRNATEQRVAEAFEALEAIAGDLTSGVDLRRAAADIYCDGFLEGVTDGRDTDCVVAACVRLASLEAEQPVPTDRIIAAGELPERQVQLAISALEEALDRQAATPVASDYLPFLTAEFDLAEQPRSALRELLKEVTTKQAFVGKDPRGTAGAALYLTSADHTQSDVAETLGVSTETLRTRSNLIREVCEDAG